jgi:hypothetical protein
MNLDSITAKAKQKLLKAQERVARAILIWLEKEPSQDRLLSVSGSMETYGPYIRYRSRGKRRASEKQSDSKPRRQRVTTL